MQIDASSRNSSLAAPCGFGDTWLSSRPSFFSATLITDVLTLWGAGLFGVNTVPLRVSARQFKPSAILTLFDTACRGVVAATLLQFFRKRASFNNIVGGQATHPR